MLLTLPALLTLALLLFPPQTGGAPPPAMQQQMEEIARALGVGCDHCHVVGDWQRDELPAFAMARRMLGMVAALNDGLLKDRGGVTCWTCHRGRTKPARLPGEALERAEAAWPPSLTKERDEWALGMSVYASSLGVTCAHCHVENDWAARSKPEHATALVMLRLFDEFPKHFTGIKSPVFQCYTCHRGSKTPERRAPG